MSVGRFFLMVVAALSTAAPVAAFAQTAPAAVSAPQPMPDPARLAAARRMVNKLLPPGIFEKMMSGTMNQMTGSMVIRMSEIPLRDLLGATFAKDQLPKLGATTLKDIMAIVDPAFKQRTELTMAAMSAELGRLLGSMEPDMRQGMAEAYAHRFTIAQMDEIDAFFSTPTGRAYAQSSVEVMQDPAYAARMQAMIPRIVQAMPALTQKAAAATASLPPPRTFDSLTPADRERLAKLLGVDPKTLEAAHNKVPSA